VLLRVDIVSVEVLEKASVMLIVAGLKLLVAPAGRPVALRLIIPVKPASGIAVIEY
jgi:hypothetical protein